MITIHKNYSLKNLNTFGIDVKARQFAQITSIEELEEILFHPGIKKDNLFVIGGGSNLLFINNFDGTILKNGIKGLSEQKLDNSKVLLSVGAGENWDDIVNYAVDKNYYGIENLSLIPGSAGAAPIQNIGAYGAELKEVFHSLEGYFVDTCEKKTFYLQDCNFGYRNSVFKGELNGKFIITKINLVLSLEKKINLTYDALRRYLESKKITDPTLLQVREAVIKIRKNKLPDPAKLGNAGSFFKNPKASIEEIENLKRKYPDIQYYPFENKYFKIAAGWMIEKVGLKGERVGNIGTHKDQALVIVNYGDAAGSEILEFAKHIQQKVFNEFGILLEPEVNIINHNQRELL